MGNQIRVRFAPSPTGPLHIGGVRTALFNYLFAKKNKGTFILRIEDTDQNRFVEGAEQYIIDSLNWCGIDIDEGPEKKGEYGPYKQSERKKLYKKYAEELVENGSAYYAFDLPEQLDHHRKNHEEKGKTFIYNWHNRQKLDNSLSLSAEETQERLNRGDDYVIRFKCPQDKTLTLNDIIRGEIKIDSNVLDDKILFKSDGMPTYHLANIVDDHLMQISHVIRGEEWLPSLALHNLLYDAFGWSKPEFAHLPLILKPTGNGKLSKRDGEKGGFPIFPLSWNESVGYKEVGYFSEAVVNFLAFLGWNPGTDQELFSMDELIQSFSLDKVNKAGARFDPDKTRWFNHQWLQKKSDEELGELFSVILNNKGIDSSQYELVKIISLVKDRADFVDDFWDLTHYFFNAPDSYGKKAVKKKWKEHSPEIIKQIKEVLNGVEDYRSENIESTVKTWISDNEQSFGNVMPPLRLVIVGDLKGPHLFDIMELVGKDECLQRIDHALTTL